MLDFKRRADLPPVRADGAHAMRANRNHLAHFGRAQRFDVRFSHLRNGQVVAQEARRIARALLLAQHAEGHARASQHARQRQYRLAALRIVCAHAAEPEAVFLRAVVIRQAILLNELLPLAGGEPQGVAGALQVEEQPGAVIVLPPARVDRAAPQSDDDRQMLYAHRTLELARSAGGAVERSLFGNALAEQRRFASRPELAEVSPQTENDLLRVQDLSGVVGRAVLRAASALHARVGLQRVNAGDVLARIQPEVLFAGERRNAAESLAPQEHGDGAERQVQVLGAGDQRKEGQ